MNRLLLLLTLSFLVSCGASKKRLTSSEVDESRPDGLKAEMSKDSGVSLDDKADESTYLDFYTNSARVSSIMKFMTSDDLEGRESGSQGIEKAAQYIEDYFQQTGVEPYFSSYRDTLSNDDVVSYNLVGIVPGSDKKLSEEYIIIGAHYDHVGFVKSNPLDSIANGANDNASGTTAVLELARYFGKTNANKRSLMFVLFGAEEKGLLGSKHLAPKLKDENFNLYAMLNFEMIGVPMADKDYLLYLTGYENSNLAELCNEYAGENLIGFLPQAKEFQLFMRSDNYPFHLAFNVPSQTYCTFDFTNYDYYHKAGDEFFRMDLGHMAEVINKMIPVVQGLSNTKEQEIKYN